MSDAYSFLNGVANLLTGDAVFAAAIQALIGVPVVNVKRGNVPLASLSANDLPCFVIEQGDGKPAPTTEGAYVQTIGLAMTSFASDLLISLVWNDQARENAAVTRSKLPTLFAQLFMRNPQPGGVDFAALTEWVPDRGVNHPTQVWASLIGGHYTIPVS